MDNKQFNADDMLSNIKSQITILLELSNQKNRRFFIHEIYEHILNVESNLSYESKVKRINYFFLSLFRCKMMQTCQFKM